MLVSIQVNEYPAGNESVCNLEGTKEYGPGRTRAISKSTVIVYLYQPVSKKYLIKPFDSIEKLMIGLIPGIKQKLSISNHCLFYGVCPVEVTATLLVSTDGSGIRKECR